MSNDSNKSVMSRKERCILAREQVFSVLFEKTFTNDSIEDILDNAVESRMIVLEDYTNELLTAYTEHAEYVDGVISDNIKGWSMSRISKVALSVLRLAVTELEYTDTPVSVAINEAVELSKKYATEKDASFVNGVLGSVAKNIDLNNSELNGNAAE